MICSKCYRKLKKGFYYRGKPYGPECIKKMGFKAYRFKLIDFKPDEKDDDQQGELF